MIFLSVVWWYSGALLAREPVHQLFVTWVLLDRGNDERVGTHTRAHVVVVEESPPVLATCASHQFRRSRSPSSSVLSHVCGERLLLTTLTLSRVLVRRFCVFFAAHFPLPSRPAMTDV